MRPAKISETRFWRPSGLGGAEFIFASYGRHSYPRHFHDEYLIANMVRGVERLKHARGTDLAPAGSLILLNPGQVHENWSADDDGFAYRTAYVPSQLFTQCLADAGLSAATSPQFSHAVVRDPETFAAFNDLHLAVEAGEPTLRLQTLLLICVSEVAGRHCGAPPARELPPPSVRRIGRVREYLDAHFAENVSLDDLGQVAGLSVFHLVRCFRDQVGLPPCQYQIHLRVRHALARLRAGVPSVTAAYEAGFVDQSHLSRHFKRIVGITPGQFCADRKAVQDATRE